MSKLRTRMIEDLQLSGLAERTQEMYVRAVRMLSEHYHKSPDLITEEELRQYFLYLKNVRKYKRSSSTIALCGIKFFYTRTLGRDWTNLAFVRAQREKKLPVILSVEEVRIRRFLQHVLPNRFVKVRYYGFMSQRNRDKLEKIRKLLGACREEQAFQESQVPDADCTSAASRYDESLVCPKCGGVMVLFRILEPKRSPS